MIPSVYLNDLLSVAAILVITVLLGYVVSKSSNYKLSVCVAWFLLAVGMFLTERLTESFPPVLRMLCIILVTLFGMKTVVSVEYYKGRESKLTFIQWISFVAGWFGMRPNLFETLGAKPLQGVDELVKFGVKRITAGSCLIILSGYIYTNLTETFFQIFSTALALIGLSLILHFGILNISAGFWRSKGAATRALFKEPMRSVSLAEFWGKRWNLAFSEMTAIALYRPLKPKIGEKAATVTAFVFSGLLHEVAISVPVKAGYGLPLLYFFIQGILIIIERKLEYSGILKNKIVARSWVFAGLILPFPVLFHVWFLKGIIWPLISW
ncbi:MBOAT family protein [Sporocytophaga myxococcoides]|uniref:MBOAT family protein n=1 Tax=Sporocytophaga myxococcoides TaxID=153721 RepID=UPI00042A4A47|nr:MBOAT family protein [Sporocytophaga myxococcoides]